jgi:hypothetical protein
MALLAPNPRSDPAAKITGAHSRGARHRACRCLGGDRPDPRPSLQPRDLPPSTNFILVGEEDDHANFVRFTSPASRRRESSMTRYHAAPCPDSRRRDSTTCASTRSYAARCRGARDRPQRCQRAENADRAERTVEPIRPSERAPAPDDRESNDQQRSTRGIGVNAG